LQNIFANVYFTISTARHQMRDKSIHERHQSKNYNRTEQLGVGQMHNDTPEGSSRAAQTRRTACSRSSNDTLQRGQKPRKCHVSDEKSAELLI